MKALVTGGGGFLGKKIVEMLLARGDRVVVLGRSKYPEVEAMGAETVQLDITKKEGLQDACEGVDVVFHVAALAGVWGPREHYWNINVEGTRNMLEAAKAAGVKKFVQTSSPSAVWDGGDMAFVTEADCPYPNSFLMDYPETKAISEQDALKANCPEMSVTAIRPRLIWGPGDPHLIPRMIERHSRLKIIGNGKNKVGICYVDNAAHAHILASDVLSPESPNAGKAYFVADDEPVEIWNWLNRFMERLGKKPITSKVPRNLAYGLGVIMEVVWRTLGIKGEPFMTRFVACSLSADYYYNLKNARADFGYHQLVDPNEGFEKMVAYFTDQQSED